MTTEQLTPVVNWVDDALDRKPLADYLTTSICAQIKTQRRAKRGITISLDAPWGTGKTFFVKNWVKDLEAANHPVIYFDAWENDIGDEASIALIASVLSGLDFWKKKIAKGKSLGSKATKLRRRVISSLRQAIIPATTIIIKGAIKKFIGTEIDDVLSTISENKKEQKSSTCNDQPSKEMDKLLDDLFELKLELHETKKNHIKEFRSSLYELLKLIENETEAKLPLFIFIDELDRCRPSYAVKLLEEIKHIFGIEDVAYIVSTNLSQLQNSVRVLYGTDFDGRGYLRRLFDREYALPLPDSNNFSRMIIRNSSFINKCQTYSGLPNINEYSEHTEKSWALIACALNLDLRTQKQVFSLAEEVIETLNSRKTVHVLWLFFLCSMFYIEKDLLESCAEHSNPTGSLLGSRSSLLTKNPKIISKHQIKNAYEEREEESTNLSNVLETYYSLSCIDIEGAIRNINNANRNDYPRSIIWKFHEEIGQPTQRPTDHLSIYDYASLVRSAGFVVTSDEQPRG